MRKLFVMALVALGATFQGEVCAATTTVNTAVVVNGSSEMDPALLHAILVQTAEESGYPVDVLHEMHSTGNLTVDTVVGGYAVSFSALADGGMAVIILMDDI